jgi:hypothetical protein
MKTLAEIGFWTPIRFWGLIWLLGSYLKKHALQLQNPAKIAIPSGLEKDCIKYSVPIL